MTGTPIVMCPDMYAQHLPHVRDSGALRRSERVKYRRFLRKWPTPDVELAHAFGEVEANNLYLEYHRELVKASAGRGLVSLRGEIVGRDVILVGVVLNADGQVDARLLRMFDNAGAVERLPLAGMALPYEDNTVEECRILPAIAKFSGKYRNVIEAEATRIAKHVVAFNPPY